MYVVGLTGQIGAGKTTLAGLLKKKGAFLLDADQIGNELLLREDIKQQITETFGKDVLADGEIARLKLAKKVFLSRDILDKLNDIMWPPITKRIEEELAGLSKTLPANTIVIIEAPLLLEAGLEDYINVLISVTCSYDKQLKRLIQRGYTEEDAKSRLKMQTPVEDLRAKSDYIIDNIEDVDILKKEAEKLWHFIKKQSA